MNDIFNDGSPEEKTTKHTPETVRKAQDIAVTFGHLGKGIASLPDLYASAPELLAALRQSLEISRAWLEDAIEESRGDAMDSALVGAARQDVKRLEAVIAKAEGRA